MFKSTKDELLDKVTEDSKNFNIKNLNPFTANYISKALNISRNLASQYLNELVKEEKLIKINSRPVYFINKKVIESIFEVNINNNIFQSIDQFLDKINTKKPVSKNFKKAIGYSSSLANNIEQCKAALKYPPNGLPILLIGQSGTGKSLLARLMYEYAIDENVIEPNSPFISVNCSEYANNPNELASRLFEHSADAKQGTSSHKKESLIESASGGILFFDEAHNLSPQCQENLCLLIDKGIYHAISNDNVCFRAQVRLMFATMKDPADVFLHALLRRIPTIVKLPPLEKRTSEEKEEMIFEFFKREAKKIGKEIFISNKVYKSLMDINFASNVGELKNCIYTSCAHALLHSNSSQTNIDIHLYDLPDYIISSAKLNTAIDDTMENEMLNLYGMTPGSSIDKILAFYDSILNTYEDYKNLKFGLKDMFNQEFSNLDKYYDYLIYEKQYSNLKIQTIELLMRNIFDYISNKYNIPLFSNYGFIISRSIYTQLQMNPEIRLWEEKRKRILDEMLVLVEKDFPKEFMVATEIKDLVKQSIDITLSNIGIILCLISVKYYNISDRINDVESIIICHGYSTASSIASAANRLIGRHVYEAMDMPLDMDFSEIVNKLKKHLQNTCSYRNLIVLVDMGSLENIAEELKCISNLNIGIVNNVSTKLAIDVGCKICQGLDIKSILDSEKNIVPETKMIANPKKDEAIIFTSETGTDTAEKMSELFISSLPKSIPIKIIPCDYVRLIKNSDKDSILNKYKVLTIIGTSNPNVPDIPFIPLENIITLKEIGKINVYFLKYFTNEEIMDFSRNILKNFSLQNIMQYLTILNADKLLDYVEDCVNHLQQLMGIKLSVETILGIYVHMCCLIERLVTKNPIETHLNLDNFIKNHEEFISHMTESFGAIAKCYGVKIPVSEIAYIYDYIENDKPNHYMLKDEN